MKEELLGIAERAVKKAEGFGADQVEVYTSSSRTFSIEVENNSIKSASEQRDAGCGIRSVVGKKIGFAYVTTVQEDDLLEAAEMSVRLAKASLPDPDFVTLPSFNGAYPEVKGLYDQEIVDLDSEEVADIIIRAVDAARFRLEGMNVAVEAKVSSSTGTKVIVNSLGINGSADTTSIWMYTEPIIKEDGEQTSSYEVQLSRNLKEIHPEWIGKASAENTLSNLGAKIIEGGELPVVLAPFAVDTILGGGFAGAVNAEEVQYGRSYIADALGEEVSARHLRIVDDGIMESGIGSRSFDAEGHPSQRTKILDNGVLKSLLHNSYTANKDNIESTGNASRAGYSGVPSISSSNFIVAPGKGTLDDLISEVGKGVLCRFTGDRPNMTTGDLSAMIMEGSYFENGEIKHPLRNTLIGINMRDLLKRVEMVGADTRVAFSIISPSVVIRSAQVTSG